MTFAPPFPSNETAWLALRFSHKEESHVPQMWWFMKMRLGHGKECTVLVDGGGVMKER